jgi:hypothetical protein
MAGKRSRSRARKRWRKLRNTVEKSLERWEDDPRFSQRSQSSDTLPPIAPPVPVFLEVLVCVPTDFFHCMHCERLFGTTGIGAEVRREVRSDYPTQMLEDGRRISDWLQGAAVRYGEQLRIRVIDPQSPEGFYKSLRYWVRRYPTFIINRRTKYTGWDPEALERLLADLCEQLNLA